MAVLNASDELQHIDHHGGVLEIPSLPDSTILLVEVGSTAHGTAPARRRRRRRDGVLVEGPEGVLGLNERGFTTVMHRTQPEGSRSGPGDTDRTLHSLRRFLRLAASGNPSILMSLWAPVLFATDEGHQLRDLADAFIGRHVVPRYRGYMQSQAMRLLGTRGGGHSRRGGGQREELVDAHGFDTKYAMHCARLGFQCIELLTTRQSPTSTLWRRRKGRDRCTEMPSEQPEDQRGTSRGRVEESVDAGVAARSDGGASS